MYNLRIWTLVLLTGFSFTVKSQTLNLVKDLNAGGNSSFITPYMSFGNDLYFFETSTSVLTPTTQLWKTDGTDAGTVQIHTGFNGNCQFMKVFNNKLFFIADDGTHGYEMWSTDGTAGGTQLFKDINPGTANAFNNSGVSLMYDSAVVLNNKMYFTPDDGVHSVEIWSTDGTAAGTSMMADLCPNPGNCGGGGVLNLINGKIFFEGATGASTYGAFVTDGTLAGTNHLIHCSGLYNFVPLNNKAVFIAHDTTAIGIFGATQCWLYSTDGTPAGTTKLLLIDTSATSDQSMVDHAYIDNGKMLVYWNRKLIVTDGTPSGSQIIKTPLYPGTIAPDRRIWLTELNGKAYFAAAPSDPNPSFSTGNVELWVSDGTSAGTNMLLDITPYNYPIGSSFVYSTYPSYLTKAGSKIFFKGRDSVSVGMWQTDGTVAGTVKLANPGGVGFQSPNYTSAALNLRGGLAYHNSMLFCNIGFDAAIGRELYKISVPNAVHEEQNSTGVFIYPNPTNGILNVDVAKDKYNVQIVNIMGVEVASRKDVTGVQQIDLGGVAPGVYTVLITTGSERISRKIILSR